MSFKNEFLLDFYLELLSSFSERAFSVPIYPISLPSVME